MMDAYSFNQNEEELVQSYETMKKGYLSFFKKLGLDVLPVVADNGAIGGKKSEEFMIITNFGEDTVLYDNKTGIALNTEILEREDYIEYLSKEYGITDISSLKPVKTTELGHIFQLGKKYSETMKDATYIDEHSKEELYYMGCYGIGVSRTLATIYEKSIVKDEKGNYKGISLPTCIAPYILQIIPKGRDELKNAEAESLYRVLLEHNVKTILDDRNEISVGAKIKDAAVLGTPYIAVLGDKTKQGTIEIESTATGKKTIITQSELAKKLIDFEKIRMGNPDKSLEDFIDFDEKETPQSREL